MQLDTSSAILNLLPADQKNFFSNHPALIPHIRLGGAHLGFHLQFGKLEGEQDTLLSCSFFTILAKICTVVEFLHLLNPF